MESFGGNMRSCPCKCSVTVLEIAYLKQLIKEQKETIAIRDQTIREHEQTIRKHEQTIERQNETIIGGAQIIENQEQAILSQERSITAHKTMLRNMYPWVGRMYARTTEQSPAVTDDSKYKMLGSLMYLNVSHEVVSSGGPKPSVDLVLGREFTRRRFQLITQQENIRRAKQEVEAKRVEQEAEAKRVEQEAEAKRVEQEAEAKRVAQTQPVQSAFNGPVDSQSWMMQGNDPSTPEKRTVDEARLMPPPAPKKACPTLRRANAMGFSFNLPDAR